MANDIIVSAIKKYLADKEDQSFEVKILKILFLIYNEIDLINPYLLGQYSLIDSNILKYGLPKEKLMSFKKELQNYIDTNDVNSFLTVYKLIMDMIERKYKDTFITNEEVKEYEKYFFAGKSVASLKEYWDKVLYKINNKIRLEEVNDNVFNPYIYYLQGKTMSDIKEMSNEELTLLNLRILRKYNLNMNDNNLKEKLDRIVNRALNPIGPLTSGNGFVDIIMLLSIGATQFMITLLALVFFLRR